MAVTLNTANESGAQTRNGFTQQHIDGVADILRSTPGARVVGFNAAVRELRSALHCDGPGPEIRFVPDAYRINHATSEIEIYEVEVTHPIPARKLADLGFYWAEWDAECDHEWEPVLFQIDRFGTTHRRALSIAYVEMAL